MEDGQAPIADWELAKRARRGDSGAFHELVDRHAASLCGLAVRLTGNAEDAQDALQETFAGAFRGLAGFRSQASVKTWLTRILVRQVARRRRDEKRHPTIRLDDREISAPQAAGALEQVDIRLDFSRALAALSDEHREVIVLRELEGMSYEQISAVLGLPPGTVESRLFRARRQLQELLKDYFR